MADQDDYSPGGTRAPIIQKPKGGMSPPHNIIFNTRGANTIFMSYRAAHLKRILLYSQIEGLIGGNPPYNPAELAKHGLSHITNVNTLDARSQYEKACLSYWNLLYTAERLANFNLNSSDPEAVRLADIISDEFDKVIKEWKPLTTVFNTLVSQIVKFGASPAFWRDERDWRWSVIELQRFYVSPQASTNTEELTCVCVESIFTAQYLFDCYMMYKGDSWAPPSGSPMSKKDYEAAKDDFGELEEGETPWNTEALEKLLVHYANASVKNSNPIQDMMDLQQRIQSGDFVFDAAFSDGFRIVSEFYREYDGRISHYMFDPLLPDAGFLYFVDRQYKTFEEGIIIFTASPGEFVIHSNKGVGQKIFAGCQATTQMDCSIIDMTKMTATPFIKTLNTGGKEFEPIRIYPGSPTNIGAAEFVQTNFGANIGQIIQASQYMTAKMSYNAANSGDDPSSPDKDQGSQSNQQAKNKSFREFAIPKNSIQHFYTSFDLVVSNMAIKMLHAKNGYPGYEYAKKWKLACIERGVPKELFAVGSTPSNEMPKQIGVKATRVAGDGSTLSNIVGLESLSPIAGSFSPRGQKEYNRQWIRATMGPHYVNTFIDENPEVGEDVSIAAVENAIMQIGQSPQVSPSNDQQTHIVSHMALADSTVRQIRGQQLGAVDADKVFALLIPHLEEHIQIYAKSIFAESFLKGIKPAIDEIVRFAQNNRLAAAKETQNQLKQAQEAQQQTQKAMSDAERKDFVAQKDVERADFKVSKQVERASEANQTRGDVMRNKNQLDAANERERIRLMAEAKKSSAPTQSVDELTAQLDVYQGNRPAALDFE